METLILAVGDLMIAGGRHALEGPHPFIYDDIPMPHLQSACRHTAVPNDRVSGARLIAGASERLIRSQNELLVLSNNDDSLTHLLSTPDGIRQ